LTDTNGKKQEIDELRSPALFFAGEKTDDHDDKKDEDLIDDDKVVHKGSPLQQIIINTIVSWKI
jgi:hypothetical protein